ncbi:hypothetical protein ACWDRB_47175 [Nonomuraea sp. NPDC003707]
MSYSQDPATNAMDEANIPLPDADLIADHGGDPFKPTHIQIFWNWDPDTGWELDGIHAHGLYIVKKTGLPGQRPASRWQRGHGSPQSALPAEYQKLAESTRPAWTPPGAALPT